MMYPKLPALLLAATSGVSLSLPGRGPEGPLPPLLGEEAALVAPLRADVEALAALGPRHLGAPESLEKAASYIESRMAATGHPVRRQVYTVRGREVANLSIEIPGRTHPEEIVVVGAHYDTDPHTPGADDNASGIAGTLAMALAQVAPLERTVRYVAFVNEEEPWFWTDAMGSVVAARESREKSEEIVGVVILESIGVFSDDAGSQSYPFPLSLFYPKRGDFIALVSASEHRSFLHRVGAVFRAHASLPSEGAALPMSLPGVGWSDHWGYWKYGYPALMVTDTAPFRNHHYHMPTDTPDRLDFERMARVVHALRWAVNTLATPD
jgi:Zn-dependent M28 family amino/carboxypeptidase